MPFEWFVAFRYLRDAKGQTSLIVAAVSVGVSVVIFVAALMGGLQTSLIEKVLGTQAHVTLHNPREMPRALTASSATKATALIVQPSPQRLKSIDQWPSVVTQAEKTRGVVTVSPMILGAGFATRAAAKESVVIRGVELERFLGIVDLRAKLTAGQLDLSGDKVLVGAELAKDLDVGVGDKIRLATTEGVEALVSIGGIFSLGTRAVDKSWVITSLRHAQSLFALPGGATTIEVKVSDVFDAERISLELHDRTGLDADSWMVLSADLLSALSAQSGSKMLIQFFVAVAVALGIASVLAVSVVQKSREIGILRAVGTSSKRVRTVFLIQGAVLGFIGSIVGSVMGAALCKSFEFFALDADGKPKFPITLDASLFLTAAALATVIGILSALVPAVRASRIDPATAIRNG